MVGGGMLLLLRWNTEACDTKNIWNRRRICWIQEASCQCRRNMDRWGRACLVPTPAFRSRKCNMAMVGNSQLPSCSLAMAGRRGTQSFVAFGRTRVAFTVPLVLNSVKRSCLSSLFARGRIFLPPAVRTSSFGQPHGWSGSCFENYPNWTEWHFFFFDKLGNKMLDLSWEYEWGNRTNSETTDQHQHWFDICPRREGRKFYERICAGLRSFIQFGLWSVAVEYCTPLSGCHQYEVPWSDIWFACWETDNRNWSRAHQRKR